MGQVRSFQSANRQVTPITDESVNQPISFGTFANEVFRNFERRWKPGTLAVNRVYLRNQILPTFRERLVHEITRAEVRRWFGSLHTTPAAANRSLPILSVIMREAELEGHRPPESNPCRQIRRYPERRRERFLTTREMSRLGQLLDEREEAVPLQVGIVRLLILTGCRQSEIRTLHWADYREGHLFLRDSKVGPRTVWLSSVGRRVLDGLPRSGSFVFASPDGSGPLSEETLYRFWHRLRSDAGLSGLRLHDLRHSYASFGLRNGETLVTIARLLGHRDPHTTLRYIHFGESLLREAVESVAEALED